MNIHKRNYTRPETETTTTATSIKNNITSDKNLCEWARIDCREKTGIQNIDVRITLRLDELYEITLTDENGDIINVYTIDPVTGIGTDSNNEIVDLPQTGNNSITNRLIAIIAFMMIGFGLVLVKYSGILRRRKNKQ